jgi:hypothetical protein
VEEADKKFGLLAICPLIPSDGFIRYDFDNRTENEIGMMARGLDVMSSFAVSQALSGIMKNHDPKLESFAKTRCAYAMIDALCADTLREVIRLSRRCCFFWFSRCVSLLISYLFFLYCIFFGH